MWYRTSGTNCARIYNDGLALKSLSPSLPPAHSKSLILDVGDVWDSLCLHWLLKDCEERGRVLEVPHDALTQRKCLQPAMVARNNHMAGPGQEEWNHACDLCCWFETDEAGKRGEIQVLPLSSDILILCMKLVIFDQQLQMASPLDAPAVVSMTAWCLCTR